MTLTRQNQERWQMPSGRIATIDLQQLPQAIEDARHLLRTFGDAELIEDEDARGAGGNQPEGVKTNSEGNDPLTTVQRAVAKIREHLTERRMTIGDLASVTGIAEATLNDELEGDRLMVDTFGRIADALGLRMSELV